MRRPSPPDRIVRPRVSQPKLAAKGSVISKPPFTIALVCAVPASQVGRVEDQSVEGKTGNTQAADPCHCITGCTVRLPTSTGTTGKTSESVSTVRTGPPTRVCTSATSRPVRRRRCPAASKGESRLSGAELASRWAPSAERISI